MKSQIISKTILFLAILTLSSLSLSGCKKEGDLKFNHKLHVVENEIECSQCHTATDEGKMQNPSMDTCGECHEINMDNPNEDCLVCHTVESSKKDYSVERAAKEKPKSFEDVIFSHEVHDGLECTTCHKGLGEAESLNSIEWPRMTTCQQCHNGEEAPKSCATCHEKVRKDVPPESHHGDWAMHHGFESRFDKSCEYCHGKDKKFCQECHRTKKPKDHIFNWKTTQHGVEATHDRRLCATCHVASFCSDCHRSQKPISHKAADWIAFIPEPRHAEEAIKNFRSCNVCHTTADCLRCHSNIILRQEK
ncbi:cytochrome c3 family protein [Dissulfuribacter thermophilus]|nr:cytochrome c3 family protein [Dissulfuribacter thermophilus]